MKYKGIKKLGLVGLSVLFLTGCGGTSLKGSKEDVKEVEGVKDVENASYSVKVEDMFIARNSFGDSLLVLNTKVKNNSDKDLSHYDVTDRVFLNNLSVDLSGIGEENPEYKKSFETLKKGEEGILQACIMIPDYSELKDISYKLVIRAETTDKESLYAEDVDIFTKDVKLKDVEKRYSKSIIKCEVVDFKPVKYSYGRNTVMVTAKFKNTSDKEVNLYDYVGNKNGVSGGEAKGFNSEDYDSSKYTEISRSTSSTSPDIMLKAGEEKEVQFAVSFGDSEYVLELVDETTPDKAPIIIQSMEK